MRTNRALVARAAIALITPPTLTPLPRRLLPALTAVPPLLARPREERHVADADASVSRIVGTRSAAVTVALRTAITITITMGMAVAVAIAAPAIALARGGSVVMPAHAPVIAVVPAVAPFSAMGALALRALPAVGSAVPARRARVDSETCVVAPVLGRD